MRKGILFSTVFGSTLISAIFLYYKLIKKSIVENLLKIVYNTKEFALIAQQDRAVAS